MKSFAITAMLLSFVSVGCSKESVPGGPGATPAGKTAIDDAKETTFTLKVPATNVNITQGSDDEVTVSIDRGSKFEQKVSLTFEAGADLTVSPDKGDLDRGQNEMKVKITASPTAAVGPADVRVTAKPETGKEVTEKFSVDVKEASKDN